MNRSRTDTPPDIDIQQLVEARTRYGHRMRVDAGDLIGRRIIDKGIFDGVSLALMLSLLQQMKARTVLDIGANIGNHALAFSGFCERVIAFEPGRRNFALLDHNLRLNPQAPVRACNFGLSSSNSEALLHLDSANFGGATLASSADARPLTERVVLKVGDEWLAEEGIGDIDAVKIDVEGHEVEVLNGIAQTLRRWRPLLFMEWNSAEVRRRFLEQRLLDTLFEGYVAHAIEHNLSKQYWQRQPAGRLRRRLRCWLAPKRAFLTGFDPALTYEHIVLIPAERALQLRAATTPPFWTFGA